MIDLCIIGAAYIVTSSNFDFTSCDAVGFLPKHTGSRRERLTASANEKATQVFFVPPHKLHQFLQEASLLFGDSRYIVEPFFLLIIFEKNFQCFCSFYRVHRLNS